MAARDLTKIIVVCMALHMVAALAQHPRATTAAPPPTFPPPKFDGYIMLAQFNCDTFECTEWELDATRLATECFTWDCQYEQQIQAVLDPEAVAAKRDFSVFTAAHQATRRFFVVGLNKKQSAKATLWTLKVEDSMKNSTLLKRVSFDFPSSRSTFVSLEAHPATGLPLALYQDGMIASIDPLTGKSTVVGNFLKNFTRMANQATTVDANSSLLYAFTRDIFGSEPHFVTFDLKSNQIIHEVPFPWLPNQVQELTAFQISYIPEISALIMFTTGKFDHLIYVDPKTGNSSWAIYDLMEDNNLGFQNDPNTRSVDTLKLNTYDASSRMLYFQASQYGSEGFATTSLVSVGPFVQGPPQPLYWVDINLSPVNFGYQGFHFFRCLNGPCPT